MKKILATVVALGMIFIASTVYGEKTNVLTPEEIEAIESETEILYKSLGKEKFKALLDSLKEQAKSTREALKSLEERSKMTPEEEDKYVANTVCNINNKAYYNWKELNYKSYQDCMDKQIKAQVEIRKIWKIYYKKDAITTKEEKILMQCTESSELPKINEWDWISYNYEQELYCLEQNL